MKKIILLSILILLLISLISCGDSTVTEPKEDSKVEAKKYTLEEILADTNWVEITDTLHYPNIDGMSNNPLWGKHIVKVIKDSSDINNLKEIVEQNWDGSFVMPQNVNLNTHSLIGYKTTSNLTAYLKYLIFRNEKSKIYYYFIQTYFKDFTFSYRVNQNWILIPKIENNYNVRCDTLLFDGE